MTAQRLANDTRNPLERLHDYGQAVGWISYRSVSSPRAGSQI